MDPAADAPRQAVILAAGRGSKLSPYTDTVPTALISIGERPLVAFSIEALRRQGVTKFVVCRGWQGAAFDTHREVLGDGVVLVDCLKYASTGMLASLHAAMPYLGPGGFYVVYGDVVFRPSVIRQLREASGNISVAVNSMAPGTNSKGFEDVEAVKTAGSGSSRVVKRIGRHRKVRQDEITGEFAGLMKVGEVARALMDATFTRFWPETGGSTEELTGSGLPWWLEPINGASLCDLLQLWVDEGSAIGVAVIFGGWHEVNTPHDLTRAQNDTAMFLSDETARHQVAAMGACLLSEANDLKRPLHIVAKELNVELSRLESLIRGDLDVSEALEVLRRMSEVYPVPLNDLWLDADDTSFGVRIFTREAAEATSRVLDRASRSGERTPYYEYRDAAMSRCSQFRPEWIKELRVVSSSDPQDPDVQLNNGHLMMQTTLFIGPVNFYYKTDDGVTHCREMNTGDSNFISSFVPHSFTARNRDAEAIIIAVTYGGNVRRAFTEFSRVGAKQVLSLAGDKRDIGLTRRCTFRRFLEAECMTEKALAEAVAPAIEAERVKQLLEGQEGTFSELEALAAALHVRPSDLHVSPLEAHEEVVVSRAGDSQKDVRHFETYRLAPLSRTRHQPDLKTFDLEVLDSAQPGETLRCGLHTFVYHFGSAPVEFVWEGGGRTHRACLKPGDSAYIAPLVAHSFSTCPDEFSSGRNPNGRACGKGRRLFLVRIPGHLNGETLAEFATFAPSGRDRVGAETVRWYS